MAFRRHQVYFLGMRPYLRVLASFIASYIAAFSGLFLIDSSASSWYALLSKPDFAPPDSSFKIALLVLYGLLAASLSFVWTSGKDSETGGWMRFYFVLLLFSAAWTLFFFGLHAVLIAFADILFVGFIVLCLMAGASEIDRRALYLLVPYMVWVIFIAYFTLRIWLMN